MSITVGLDFGTHQTKICLEDTSDPHHITHEFWKWDNGSYVLPSIIQINKDKTLTYGKVTDQVLIGRKRKYVEKPKDLQLPPVPDRPENLDLPIPEFPPEPIHSYTNEIGEIIEVPVSKLYGIETPVPRNNKYIKALNQWKNKCHQISKRYQKEINKYKLLREKFGIPEPKEPNLPPKPKPEDFQEISINKNLIASDEQKRAYNHWKNEIFYLKQEYNIKKEIRNNKVKEYNKKFLEWKKVCEDKKRVYNYLLDEHYASLEESPLIFKYFKQATFSIYHWEYFINPEELSILYLAYIIFNLEKKLDKNDFHIQMGVPTGESTMELKREQASLCLLKAYMLVEEVFENDYERFLSTPYDELIDLIPQISFSEDLKYEYGIMILPEAYAALSSLTERSKISSGMSIMLDLGGGTTDISFFTINEKGINKTPHIHHYESVPKGLNFILEFNKNSKKEIPTSIDDLDTEDLYVAVEEYQKEIKYVINSLIKFLYEDFRKTGKSKSQLTNAITNRPIIYAGGGSHFDILRREYVPFTDVIHCNKGILGFTNIKKERNINIPYSILATAFGLSVSIDEDRISISSIDEFFSNIKTGRSDKNGYEHGLTDI